MAPLDGILQSTSVDYKDLASPTDHVFSDSAGNVTYKSVWLDGVDKDTDETVPSAFALNWGPALLTNFQVNGLGGYGSPTVYLDNLTVYRW